MTCSWAVESLVEQNLRSLTGFLPRYVRWAAAQTDAPGLYHAGVGLSLLAAVLPPHYGITDAPGGGTVRGNVFVVLVGRQGIDRKSTAIKLGMSILDEAVPMRRQSDPESVQAFIDMASVQQQLLLAWEDMAAWLTQTQQRRGGNHGEALKAKMLEAFDCAVLSRLRVERRGHKHEMRQENPRISIITAINQVLLGANTTEQDWSGGLWSRFLVFFAERERSWVRCGANARPEDREYLVEFLRIAAGKRPDEWGPYRGMTSGAANVSTAFTWAVEHVDPALGSKLRTAGPLARTPLMAWKIALLVAWGEGQGWYGMPFIIERNVMRAAVAFALQSCAGSIALAASVADSPDMRRRQRILGSIGYDWTPLADILKGSHTTRRKALEMIQTLLAENTIEQDQNALLAGTSAYRLLPGAEGEVIDPSPFIDQVVKRYAWALRELDSGRELPHLRKGNSTPLPSLQAMIDFDGGEVPAGAGTDRMVGAEDFLDWKPEDDGNVTTPQSTPQSTPRAAPLTTAPTPSAEPSGLVLHFDASAVDDFLGGGGSGGDDVPGGLEGPTDGDPKPVE